MSEKMDYLESAKEFQERPCGEARANTEKLWWASTKFPEELAAWVSALLDKVRQTQAELARNLGRAEGRQMEFMIMKGERPADSCYWDMHHKKELDGELEAAKKLCIAALGRK